MNPGGLTTQFLENAAKFSFFVAFFVNWLYNDSTDDDTKGAVIMGKFVVKETKSGVKFDLKAGNGETILSSEVYSSERSCLKGVASVQRNAPVAAVEDQTVEGFAQEKCPKFEIYADKAGEFRFRLKATNGQIIGVSESYKAMTSCVNGIESVKKNAAEARIDKANMEEK